MNSVSIRVARIEDTSTIIAGINTICAEGDAFYVTHFVPSPEWEAVLYRPETMPDHLMAVAEVNGEFAGSGRLFPGPPHSFMRHVVDLGIFVLKPYRHQGVGTRLLAWMLEWATQHGYERVTLSVFETNLAAIVLYRKFGFEEEGRLCRQLKIGADYVDMILMSRFL